MMQEKDEMRFISQNNCTGKENPPTWWALIPPYTVGTTLNNTTIQVTPEGLEPSTCALRVRCSAKLSYGAIGQQPGRDMSRNLSDKELEKVASPLYVESYCVYPLPSIGVKMSRLSMVSIGLQGFCTGTAPETSKERRLEYLCPIRNSQAHRRTRSCGRVIWVFKPLHPRSFEDLHRFPLGIFFLYSESVGGVRIFLGRSYQASISVSKSFSP